MTPRDRDRLMTALRILRHLYEQMLDGRVTNNAAAARGLLGPSIEVLEVMAHGAGVSDG